MGGAPAVMDVGERGLLCGWGFGMWNVGKPNSESGIPMSRITAVFGLLFFFDRKDHLDIKKKRQRNSFLEIISLQGLKHPEVRQNFKLHLNHLVFILKHEWDTQDLSEWRHWPGWSFLVGWLHFRETLGLVPAQFLSLYVPKTPYHLSSWPFTGLSERRA